MLIRSNFKDCYDSVQALGSDHGVVYERNTIRCSFNDMFPTTTFTVASFNPNIHIGKYKYSNEEKKFILVSGRTIEHKFNKDENIDNITLNYF